MHSRSIEFALQNYSVDVIEVNSNRILEFALNPVCSADTAYVSLGFGIKFRQHLNRNHYVIIVIIYTLL